MIRLRGSDIKFIVFGVLLMMALSIVGCSSEKRCQRKVNRKIIKAENAAKDCGLTINDTIVLTVVDTIVIPKIIHDTTTQIVYNDSVTVVNNERVRLVYYYDTLTKEIYHEHECKEITHHHSKEIRIPTEKIIHTPTNPWYQDILLCVVFLCVIWLILKPYIIRR